MDAIPSFGVLTGWDFFMEERIHAVTVTIYNRDLAYLKVSELLHQYARFINLRVGYPVPSRNIAIIFLILTMTNDALGALTGKLGQISSVKVKANTLSV